MPVSTCAHFRLLLLISYAISSLGVEKVHEHVVMRSAPVYGDGTPGAGTGDGTAEEESWTAPGSPYSEDSSGLPLSGSSNSATANERQRMQKIKAETTRGTESDGDTPRDTSPLRALELPPSKQPHEEVEGAKDLTSPDAEPTKIDGPCESLAQDAKQVPKNVNGDSHGTGPSGVDGVAILDAFEKCVSHVMTTIKPDLKKKTVAVQSANEEYLDAFNHVFYHLKRLKESELSKVFEDTHKQVWDALEKEATGLEDTLKGMKLDKEEGKLAKHEKRNGHEVTAPGNANNEANEKFEDEAARMRGIDIGAGTNNEADEDGETESRSINAIGHDVELG